MPPAAEPTKNSPVTLPDRCNLFCAKPKVLGKTGATEAPKPMVQVQIRADEGGKTNKAMANNVARLMKNKIIGNAAKRVESQMVASRPKVNAAQNAELIL